MSKKRVEVVGWHSIVIEMVNKDANCSLEVLTTQPGRIISTLASPDVVAVSWEFGSQEYLVKTEHIVRVIVEAMEPAQLDDGEREELVQTATATTASVQYRLREAEDMGYGRHCWHPVWRDTSKDTP